MKDINVNAGRHFFYARVSSKDQNLDRQLERAREIGITSDYIYIDKASGKNMERQGLKDLLETVQKNDTIHLIELSRLSRNYKELQQTLMQLKLKGVKVIADDLPLMTTDDKSLNAAMTDMFIALLGWVADNERKKTLERQRQGIEQAKKKGAYKGRQAVYTEKATGATKQIQNQRQYVYDTIKVAYDKGDVNKFRLARDLGISRTTVYNVLRRIEKDEKQEQAAETK